MSTDIPSTSPFQLTTTDCNFFLPGIQSYYGADRPIDAHIKVLDLHDIGITSTTNLMSGKGALQVQFWVELADGTTEMATQITLTDITFSFTAIVSGMDVTIQIN